MLFNKLNSISAILIAVFIFSFAASEAADQIKKIKIKTPTVQCGMCKKTIEKSLNKIDGIESVDVNYKKKFAKIKYNSEVITVEDIREAISKTGYQADKVQADKKAYKKLHNCCKLPEDR